MDTIWLQHIIKTYNFTWGISGTNEKFIDSDPRNNMVEPKLVIDNIKT
jgi:hypothetical protein